MREGGNVKRIAIVLAGLLVIPLLADSASAAEKAFRRYRATTSDGQTLRFRTVRDEEGRRLDYVFFGEGFQLPCDDGTTEPWSGAGYSHWPWFFEGQTVTVDEWYPGQGSDALHIEGTFGPDTASGTFRYTAVFLHEDETPRLCSTGDLTWTAQRIYWTPPTPT